jgi:hypothetical protein
MDFFENIKIPQISKTPTHRIRGENAFFIKSNDSAPKGILSFNTGTRTLPVNTEVIVLEHAVGYKCIWTKVKFNEEIGFLETKVLEALQNTKPFCEVNINFTADEFSIQTNWKDKRPNLVYYDEYTGKFSIHYELPYEKVDGKEDLLTKLDEAYFLGTKRILQENGKVFTDDYVRTLLNNFYQFAQVEEYFFPLRPCSTLRALVTIPKKYLESGSIRKSLTSVLSNPLIPNENLGSSTGDIFNRLPKTGGGIIGEGPAEDGATVPHTVIEYSSFIDFKNHINKIANRIKQVQIAFAAGINGWYIEPAVDVNLIKDLSNLIKFYELVNKLLENNISTNLLSSQTPLDRAGDIASVVNTAKDELLNFISLADPDFIWNGKLSLYIEEGLNLSYIEFTNPSNQKEILNIGILAFLEDPIVTNKTLINYIKSIPIDLLPPPPFGGIVEALSNIETPEINFEFPNESSLVNFFSNTDETSETNINSENKIKENIQKLSTGIQTDIKNNAKAVEKGIEDLKQFGRNFLPEALVEDFLKNFYYPKISTARMNPIDLANCVENNYDRITNIIKNKLPNEVKTYSDFLEKARRDANKNEGDIFKKLQADFNGIQDPNVRALFGLDPDPVIDPKDNILQVAKKKSNRVMAGLNIIDWPRIIAEALKCLSTELDPEVLQSLLSVYKSARDFVEDALLITICNPYLSSILQKINSLQLPILPTINRNQSLSDLLVAQLIKIVNELLILLVRQLLNSAIKGCLTNPKSNFGTNNPEGINNSIDAGLGANDPNINSLLDDLFNGITDDNGIIDPIKQQEAAEKLKNLVDDIITCLTPEELCRMLLGYSVNDEVYEVIISIVKRKYNTPNADYNLANKLNNIDTIKDLFKKVGSNTGINLTICQDLLNRAPIDSFELRYNCDAGAVRKIRERLLLDKGLTDELVNDLLNDIKNKKEKEVEDLLNALNSNNLEDILNISAPSTRCTKQPDGTTKPPTLNIAPSIDNFNDMLGDFFNDYYDLFDSEALDWYRTTYSIKKSTENNTLVFDEETGKIKPTETSIANLKNLFSSENATAIANGNTEPDEILMFYLLKDILQNNKYSINNTNEYYKLFADIDGFQQQSLDINIITNELRNNIEIAEKSLNLFITRFLNKLAAYTVYTGGKFLANGINDFFLNPSVLSNSDILQNIGEAAGYAAQSDFAKLIKVFDLFARNNLADAKSLQKAATVLGLNNSDQAAAFFLSSQGAPTYLTVMEYITNNINQLTSLINTIYSVDITTEILVWLNDGRRPSAERGTTSTVNLEEKTQVLNFLNEAIKNYSLVKTYYQTVSNVAFTYPKFSIDYSINSSKLNIDNNYSFSNYSNNRLYELYDIQINKNATPYIKIKNGQILPEEITDYLKNILNLNLVSLNKELAYNEFINHKKTLYNKIITIEESNDVVGSNPYALANSSCLKNIQQSILSESNILLKTYVITNELPEVEKEEDKKGQSLKNVILPYTSYIGDALKTEVTSDQKACKKRPHYLDIDDVKREMLTNKRDAVCLDEIIEEKVKNNVPVRTDELENLETTESQNIMLSGQYRLMLRVFLHDILLRGIAVFGVYDPQSLRKNEAFINFMADLVESEIRGYDNTVFNLFLSYLYKQYLFRNPNYVPTKIRETTLKRDLFIDAVRKELKQNVLAKLSKRILEDTNRNIVTAEAATGPVNNLIVFKNIYNSYTNLNKYIIFRDDGIFVKTLSQSNLSEYVKIFDGTKEQFRQSIEFKVLFEYFVPLNHHLNYLFMINVLSTSTRRQVVSSFRKTKLSFFSSIKITQAHGLQIIADPNNPQDIVNLDDENFWQDFIRERLVKTPLEIFKGFMETGDPNIALVNAAYKLIKSFAPEQSSLMIPALSIPLGIPLPPPYVLGIVPYNSFILAAVYFASGVWYDDDKKLSDKSKNTFLERMLINSTNPQNINCEQVPEKEKINLSSEGYYVWGTNPPNTFKD